MKPAPPVTRTRSPIGGRIWPAALIAVAGGLTASLLAACGSTSFRRAAEPADSPPLTAPPAGKTRRLGGEPEGLVFDPASGLLAVGLRHPRSLVFVDPETLVPRRRMALPAAPRHLAYAPAEAAVVVPAESADRVLEVTPAGIQAEAKAGTHPHAAASLGEEIFVADEHSDQVSVLRHGELVATLPAPHQPGGIATFAGGYVGLVAVSERVLQVYDAGSGDRLGSTGAGVGPTHIVALGDRAYVADTEGDLVREFAIGPRPRQIATAPAPGAPYGIAVDPRRGRLWVTLTASNRLAEYAVGSRPPRLLATYATVRQPNSVAVEPASGAVFVAGRRDGELQRIAPSPEEEP